MADASEFERLLREKAVQAGEGDAPPADEAEPLPAPEEDEIPPEPDLAALPDLVAASDLLPPEERNPEPAELGFEMGNRYRGLEMIPDPGVPHHAHLDRRFYVRSPRGEVGLVPWPGSIIVWPWEKAWEQDLYHEKLTPQKQAIMAAFKKSMEKGKGGKS